MRAQLEIKMANVKSETLIPDIANGVYVKFQWNLHIFCIEQHSGTNVKVQDVGVGEKLKIAVWNRK